MAKSRKRKTPGKLIINGRIIDVSKGGYWANMCKVILASSPDNNGFKETPSTQIRYGKRMAWPVPRTKGNHS